ncbi:MAG TPA: IS110 family transposase [Gammaproteobacteria bacterium]|nr:IS110 family transposase [Xanthomonadales bacterium]MCB1595812.1 IS110 family transposase [Xanthomonadales bacterium]HOP23195.1 IS110 family transposase [Gammaproteobacteria bacterium]HPI94925.1 IS110 family transposase [Gammaproteobacteria bacterium]HPQ86518.1 IS110 family transposase [Gammaproteobacteria bacterium]
MKHCKLLGIDLAKSVFQLCGMDINNHVISNKNVIRSKLLESVINTKPDVIFMESCYSANYWGRVFQSHGFKVKLIPPIHVKPFVKGNKNDHNDALAICEASQRPGIYFVEVKTQEQQDLQALHNIRQRRMRDRTALANQIRGLLAETGILLSKGHKRIPKVLPLIIEDATNEISFPMREALYELVNEYNFLTDKLSQVENQIRLLCDPNEDYHKLQEIPGIGFLIASAIISQIGNAREFKNARGLAAWLGLTPKHHASGNKIKNQGISKRGNRYIRTLLVHGARSIVCLYKNKQEPMKIFADRMNQKLGLNKATVAVAHKLSRIVWAVLAKQQNYNPQLIIR